MATALQIRRKIDTVGTIKQTADAMRIVAMSSHTRLKREKDALDAYRAEVSRISALVYKTKSLVQASRKTSAHHTTTRSKRLVILVGTQKGLCGNFNNELLRFFQKSHPLATLNNILGKTLDIIVIGRQVVSLFEHYGIKPTKVFPNFAPQNLDALSNTLLEEIHNRQQYHEATIFSNYPETFFLQKPRVSTLFQRDHTLELEPNPNSAYTYEQSYDILARGLTHLNEQTNIRSLLFHSLLAEQAARFISMDSASMSADKMLAEMKTSYNKLRQAAITLELQDLMSGSL